MDNVCTRYCKAGQEEDARRSGGRARTQASRTQVGTGGSCFVVVGDVAVRGLGEDEVVELLDLSDASGALGDPPPRLIGRPAQRVAGRPSRGSRAERRFRRAVPRQRGGAGPQVPATCPHTDHSAASDRCTEKRVATIA